MRPGHSNPSRPPERFALAADALFDGDALLRERAVVVRGSRVEALLPRAELPSDLFCENRRGILAPGFVDLQVNGGGDVLFGDALERDELERIAVAHGQLGTTALLPTLISADRDRVRRGIELVRAAIAAPPANGARILGIHIEGPHLAPARGGAHDPRALRPLEPEDLELLSSPGAGVVVVTLAPERVRAEDIRALDRAGVRVFAGHSDATAEQIAAARGAGLTGFTHLFNAMPPLRAREPGVLGAALADADAYAGIIADGAHVHWDNLRFACRAKPDRLFLVSDAMPPVGGSAQGFDLAGVSVAVEGGRCVRADGTLAGSAQSLGQAVRNLITELGFSLERALAMASRIPATCLGLGDRLGRIAPGCEADFVLLDENAAIAETWVGGRHSTPRAG